MWRKVPAIIITTITPVMTMIDLHCHILPGLDDGARNEEEALAMAETAVKDGITTIVATPHVLDQGYRGARERIAAQVEDFGRLRAADPLLICRGGGKAAPEVPGIFVPTYHP